MRHVGDKAVAHHLRGSWKRKIEAQNIQGQVDSVCTGNACQILAVQGGLVRYIQRASPEETPWRNLSLGHYLEIKESLVPGAKAAVRALRSAHGWRIIVSAFLDHQKLDAGLRIRFFDPTGTLRNTSSAMFGLDQAKLGHLFGDDAEILLITTEEEHSYNVLSEFWLLPKIGDPKQVLEIQGVAERFVRVTAGVAPERLD